MAALADGRERFAKVIVGRCLARAPRGERFLRGAPVALELVTVAADVLRPDDLRVALGAALVEIDLLAARLAGGAGRREPARGFIAGLLVVRDRGEMGELGVRPGDQQQPWGREGDEQSEDE